ncbi:hypothetical protein [Pedobacter sp. ASV12]|uniref:hypothetical protein n=1 Tax=Pedobacter sp. ASV12 TaxID=2795120 RepID=UPI0018ECC6A5|nr:hypothetical protein [Pedobacter sp. ASV12]
MKNFCLSLFFIATLLFVYSCKKEVVEPQPLVQKQILGRWPLRYTIKNVAVDNIRMWPDTTNIYNPVDTLVFRTDGKVITRRAGVAIDSTTYSIDAQGMHITFGTGSPKKLSFVRYKSLGIATETIVKNGSSTTTTIIEDQYFR